MPISWEGNEWEVNEWEVNEFKNLDTDPRPLVATLGDNVSHIFCIKDLDTKEFFIIDTSSDSSTSKKQ